MKLFIPVCRLQMSKKGTISYLNENRYEFQFAEFSVRIEKLTNEIARVYFVNPAGADRHPPPNTHLLDLTTRQQHPHFNGSFFITWSGNQRIMIADQTLLEFNNQRCQSVEGDCLHNITRDATGFITRYDGYRISRNTL